MVGNFPYPKPRFSTYPYPYPHPYHETTLPMGAIDTPTYCKSISKTYPYLFVRPYTGGFYTRQMVGVIHHMYGAITR